MIEPTRSDTGTEREQFAWAAGLFEGEGCFNAFRRRSKWGVQVRLAMTDEDVVRRFAAIMGVGPVRAPRQQRPDWKPIFEWYVQDASDVVAVIERLLPWLGDRRRAKALEVAQVAASIGPRNAERTHCPNGHPYAGDNLLIERPDGTGRRCRTCRNEQSRQRARERLGITPDRWRV